MYFNQISGFKCAGVRVRARITMVAAAKILNTSDDKNLAEKKVREVTGRVRR